MQPNGSVPAGADGRRGRRRLVLVLVAGVVALLCLGGAGVVFVLYDQETRIDRGSPEVAANDYLTALLVQRDRQRAALSACNGAQLAGTESLLAEITRREDALDTGFSVNVENLVVAARTDTSAQVAADIRRSAQIDGVRQSVVDRVRLDVRDQDGWRVCGASKVS